MEGAVKPNDTEAFSWFERAARKGNIEAMFNLGVNVLFLTMCPPGAGRWSCELVFRLSCDGVSGRVCGVLQGLRYSGLLMMFESV